jgi:hypothetical protein
MYIVSRKGVYATYWWENVSFSPDPEWRDPKDQTNEEIFQATILDMLTKGGKYHPKLDADLIEDDFIRAYLIHPTTMHREDPGDVGYREQWEAIRTTVGKLVPTLRDASAGLISRTRQWMIMSCSMRKAASRERISASQHFPCCYLNIFIVIGHRMLPQMPATVTERDIVAHGIYSEASGPDEDFNIVGHTIDVAKRQAEWALPKPPRYGTNWYMLYTDIKRH